MSRISSRVLMAVVGTTGLLGTVALAGCSSSDDAAGAAAENTDGRGPITFAMGKNDIDKLKPVVEKWNEQNPDEQVSVHELAGEADAQRETLVQSLQSGNADYDVMALDLPWTADFAANQWITPLTGDMEVNVDGLLKAPLESATYNDTLYAMPQNTNAQLLFRRTDLIPDAPEKFDDIAASCDKAEGVGAGEGTECLTTQLKQYEGLTVSAVSFINGWGGSVLEDDGTTPAVDSSEAQEGLEALVDAYNDGVISQASTGATEEETNLAFTEGNTAYAVNWPYMWANAQDSEATKGKVEVQAIVGKDGTGASALGGYNNAINAFSEKKATAKDFISFVANEDNQRSFALASFPPVRASVYEDAEVLDEQPYFPALRDAIENATPRPVTPFYTAVSKAIQDNTYAALTSGKDVAQATEDMKAAIENASRS